MMPYCNAIHGPRATAAFAFPADARGTRSQLAIRSNDHRSAKGISRPHSQFEQWRRLHSKFVPAPGGHVRVLRIPSVRRSSFSSRSHASSMDCQPRPKISQLHQRASVRHLARTNSGSQECRAFRFTFILLCTANPNGLGQFENCTD